MYSNDLDLFRRRRNSLAGRGLHADNTVAPNCLYHLFRGCRLNNSVVFSLLLYRRGVHHNLGPSPYKALPEVFFLNFFGVSKRIDPTT